MTSDELRAAKISAASGLIGAFIGGIAAFAGTLTQSWSQEKLEVGKVRAEAATQDRKDFLSKSEKLFGALSDLQSFFDTNHTFELKQAKPVVAQARKAAMEFAVFTSPELALKAIAAIEAVNQGAEANNSQQLRAALEGVAALTKEVVTSFYKERAMLDQNRTKALQ